MTRNFNKIGGYLPPKPLRNLSGVLHLPYIVGHSAALISGEGGVGEFWIFWRGWGLSFKKVSFNINFGLFNFFAVRGFPKKKQNWLLISFISFIQLIFTITSIFIRKQIEYNSLISNIKIFLVLFQRKWCCCIYCTLSPSLYTSFESAKSTF